MPPEETADNTLAFRWFGKSWGAPVCEGTPHEGTPVGIPCHRCKVAIKDGDAGFMVPTTVHVMPDLETVAVRFDTFHRACFGAELGVGG